MSETTEQKLPSYLKDIDAELDAEFGKEGTPEREAFHKAALTFFGLDDDRVTKERGKLTISRVPEPKPRRHIAAAAVL
ncbi:MAG: hypothetical protein LBR50_00225 [Tannerella sp.]|nr:hypothetical protein [Tannerella sp.]